MGRLTILFADGVPMAIQCSKRITMTLSNLFADVPVNRAEEQFTTLFAAASVRVERIVSHGHASPPGYWYDQDQHEWVVVLQGAARLRFESGDVTRELTRGDFIHIAAHVRHRVEWTTPDEPTIWLAIFYEERDGQ